MNAEAVLVDRLVALMGQQSEKLDAFATLQRSMQQAIIDRDWDELEAIMISLGDSTSALESVESQRIDASRELTTSLGLPESTPLSEICTHLSRNTARRLGQAQRALEISVMKVRGVTGGIDAYLAGAMRTNREVLDQLFPDQRGTMYSRRGRRAHADNRAIVVDRKL